VPLRKDVRHGALAVTAQPPQRHGHEVRVLRLGAQPPHLLEEARQRRELVQPPRVALQVQLQSLHGLLEQQRGRELLQLVVPQAQLPQV
jgi:hypothetical protein